MAIVLFFCVHWQLSVLFQSIFQHRYASHRQFAMTARVERIMHLLDYVVLGSCYMPPGPYAVMHRQHHAFADTERDPHAPGFHPNVAAMMAATGRHVVGLRTGTVQVEEAFWRDVPEWPLLERIGTSWPGRIAWGLTYGAIYYALHRATGASLWWFLLLPLHWVMVPLQGAIVNWLGHAVGYRNFDTADASRNTLPLDVLTMGELYQNNHHRSPKSACFGARWFELDPAYVVLWALDVLGVIQLRGPRMPAAPSRAAHG